MEFDLYKRFWPYIKRYFHLTGLAVLATLVVSGTNGLIAWMVQPVLDNILIDRNAALLNLLAIGVAGVFTVKGAFTYFQSYLIQYTSLHVIKDIRNELYHHVVYFPLSEYNKTSTGVLISKVITDVTLVSQMASNLVKGLLEQSFTIIGLLVVVFIRDWQLALISVTILPFAAFFISKYGRRIRTITRKARESVGLLINNLQENSTGIRIIKTFTTEEKEFDKFTARNKEFTDLMVKNARVASRISPTTEVLAGLAAAAVIYYGGGRVIGGGHTPGELISFLVGMGLLYQPVKTLGNLNNNLQQSLAAAERVFALMDTITEEPLLERGGRRLDGVEERIEYRDVTYTYTAGEDDVIRGLDLTIERGEVVALVGASGSGKSTVANLLPRFYDLDVGGIYIDGVNIKEFGLRELRDNIALVTQDTILFNDSIRNNIAYAIRSRTEEDIRNAARAAYADKFIDKLPEGYDTVVGEKGVRLSGGEKQRVSIARAILKDSPILILDEATSSLDTESERMVQNALENLMKDRTTLVIAHRLSTVINADKIVVMDKGRIMGIGRHDELLKNNGIYRKLYEMQFSVPVTADEETN